MAAIWRRGNYFPCRHKLLTGNIQISNIGSLCEQQPLKALRAPGGPVLQYKILYYFPKQGRGVVAMKPRHPRRIRGKKAS
jgi:hypothetical protein